MVIFAPYRICLLGAHVDHQLGAVLGTTLRDMGIYLTWTQNSSGKIRLYSINYKQLVEFPLDSIPSRKEGCWSDYAKGAVYALRSKGNISRGIDGIIRGTFPGGGLSSSAAVSIAYLSALEKANGLNLSEREKVRLVQKIENEYIGLDNGIMDQSMILLSRDTPDSMVYLDCKTMEHKSILPPHPPLSPLGRGEKPLQPAPSPLSGEGNNHPQLNPPPSGEKKKGRHQHRHTLPSPLRQDFGGQAIPSHNISPDGRGIKDKRLEFEVAVVYSGIEKPITNTDYNKRVAECEEAAGLLMEMAGTTFHLKGSGIKGGGTKVKLRDVPEEVFLTYKNRLPLNLQKRATHFFTETGRVEKGADMWRKGDMEGFGRLVSESGRSSIENYECGSPVLVRIYELLNSIPGVYGARFSGAGFRGSCIGIIQPSEETRSGIEKALKKYYEKEFPMYSKKYKVAFCKTGGTVKVL